MLELVVVWQDADLIECDVRVRSEDFAASARIYFTADTLRELAATVAGFPGALDDARRYETANSDGGNTMMLELDGNGLFVELHDNEESKQYAGVRLHPEAAAIDRFERELLHLATDREGTALLRARSN